MFILTRFNQNMGIATVYDTDDKSNDDINITILAKNIVDGTVRVHGLPKLTANKKYNYTFPQLGIAIDTAEAEKAMRDANMRNSRRNYR